MQWYCPTYALHLTTAHIFVPLFTFHLPFFVMIISFKVSRQNPHYVKSLTRFRNDEIVPVTELFATLRVKVFTYSTTESTRYQLCTCVKLCFLNVITSESNRSFSSSQKTAVWCTAKCLVSLPRADGREKGKKKWTTEKL